MRTWAYLVVWEFTVKPEHEERFRQAYGPKGVWAQFFAADLAYLGTELVCSSGSPRTYLTLDFWRSEVAYEHFRERHAAEYETIDAKCADLTESEREVGRYLRAMPASIQGNLTLV